MEVDAFLADSVVVAEGKLFVQGAGWNIIWTNAVPARHPRIGIGALIHVPYTATNQLHEFSISLVDQDENKLPVAGTPQGADSSDGPVTELRGQFNMGRPPALTPGDEQFVPLAVNLDGLEFPTANMYSVVISIDGTVMKRLPIRVQLVATQMTASSPR